MSQRLQRVFETKRDLMTFDEESIWARGRSELNALDFVEGNPHELPAGGFVEALQRRAVPEHDTWFSYATNVPASRTVVAASLRERLGIPVEDHDVFMTNGAFAGLAVVLTALVDPGDEVLYVTPSWFWYDALIVMAGGEPVPVATEQPSFDLDLAAIRAAITARTRALVINSPHSPSGRIYPAEMLRELATLLADASADYGRPIALISDEAYCRVVYDGHDCPSPIQHYRYTFLVYTYAKTLLAPGQRIGYIALSSEMPDREHVRPALNMAQKMIGWAYPNALLQHALPDLERLSLDLTHFQDKRDRVVAALRAMGYRLNAPEGTYYLLVRTPEADDREFVERLAREGVFVLPGTYMGASGYFRLTLTASLEMIERALPIFAQVFRQS